MLIFAKKLHFRYSTGFLLRPWIVTLFELWCPLTNRDFNFAQVHEFVLNFCDFGKKNPTSFISNLGKEIENLQINFASHGAFHRCFKKRYFENMRQNYRRTLHLYGRKRISENLYSLIFFAALHIYQKWIFTPTFKHKTKIKGEGASTSLKYTRPSF